jgi:hypothetical protein
MRMIPTCPKCSSPDIRSEGQKIRVCRTCQKTSVVNPDSPKPPRARWRVSDRDYEIHPGLFRCGDCSLDSAHIEAEFLFAAAVYSQIPPETMLETIVVTEAELGRLEFLVYHGVLLRYALDLHLNFRNEVVKHYRALCAAEKVQTGGKA